MHILATIPGARHAGLMSYFVQVISNLYVTHCSGNKLYVLFDNNMRYKDASYGENVWEYYFEQPYNITLAERENIYTKDVWLNGHLSIECRPSIETRRIANLMCTEYIRLKQHVVKKINNFWLEHKNKNETVLAVHKRGTDHVTDAPLLSISEYYEAVDRYIDRYDKLLICSDEEYSINDFKKRYGNSKVIAYNSIRAETPTNIGVHHSVGTRDPYRMGEDVVIETYLMSQSNMLIKTVSNVSNSSLFLALDLEYISIDEHIKY
jgi:hypothetical protein